MGGICALLFFSVLSFGAVEEWAISSLEIGFAFLFLLWAAQQVISGEVRIQSSPLYAPTVLFGIVVLIQCVFGVTAYRYVTLIAARQYLAYGVLLFLTIDAVNGRDISKVIAWTFTAFASALAVFAIVQDVSPNGKIYWLRSVTTGGSIFGPYVDHDHYAGLMEMLAPIPVVLGLTSLTKGGKRVLLVFSGVLTASTIVLSQSRAGTAAFLIEMAVLLAFVSGPHKNSRLAAMIGTVCLLAFAFVAWVGTAGLWHHFTELRDWMRLAVAQDGLRMFVHKPLLGWGLGTFTTVYPQFRSFYTSLFVNAAHNDYVQVLVETGSIGFAAVMWFIVAVYRAGLRNIAGWDRDWSRALGISGLIGCTGIMVHSAFDFNLQIPANACVFYFMCALATHSGSAKLVTTSGNQESPRSRPTSLIVGFAPNLFP